MAFSPEIQSERIKTENVQVKTEDVPIDTERLVGGMVN
jgi:hypothetical protein